MTGEKFCHLHNHSSFSLLDGLSSVKTLASCAANMGYKSLALTDHGTCAGLFQFTKACKEFNIKPILGMEAYICKDHSIKEKNAQNYNSHIVLLAKNKIGYKNLIYLSSFGYIKGFYYRPRIDFNELQAHSEGLIVSSACIKGEIPQLLLNGNEEGAIKIASKYKEIFKDDFYLEIMLHKYNDSKRDQEDRERKVANLVYKLGKKLNIKVIATQDTHYAHKDDWEAHDVLLAIQMIDTIKNPKRFTLDSKDFYLKSYDQMAELFSKAPDVILNTVEISEKVENNLLSFGEDLLPKFDVPEGFSDEEAFLKTLVTNGMKEKGLFTISKYRERIKYEMSVIIGCKYTKYFLILWDIINFARREKIRVGVGRGCFLPDNIVNCKDRQKKILEVNVGDMVLSYDGKYHEVLKRMEYTIDEEIIEINLEDGRKISCTGDHKIHVKRGLELKWIEAKDLTDTDEIYDILDN